MESFVPVVVPGLATGSSSPSSSSSSTSLPQNESDNIPSSPATQRSDDMNVPASRNRSHNPINSKNKNKNGDSVPASRNQLRDLLDWSISKTKKYQHSGTHPPTLLEIQIRNVLPKWYRARTAFLLTSRKIEIARSAREPRWQGLFAEGEMAKLCLVQKTFGDVMTADHKVLNEDGESRNISIRSHGTRCGYSMDTSISVSK